MKLTSFVAEFRNNTGQTISEGGSGDETTGKEKVISLQRAMTKKVHRQFFEDKIDDTISFRHV